MKREVQENDPAITTKIDPLVPMSTRELITVIVAGLATGIVIFLIAYVLNKFVFGSVLCRPQNSSDCSSAPAYAMIVAIILGSIGGLATLARLRVYRPLLVVIATAISLWGIGSLTQGLPWYGALLLIAGMFGLTNGLYAWVVRIRSFIFTIVVSVLLIVAIRLALVS